MIKVKVNTVMVELADVASAVDLVISLGLEQDAVFFFGADSPLLFFAFMNRHQKTMRLKKLV